MWTRIAWKSSFIYATWSNSAKSTSLTGRFNASRVSFSAFGGRPRFFFGNSGVSPSSSAFLLAGMDTLVTNRFCSSWSGLGLALGYFMLPKFRVNKSILTHVLSKYHSPGMDLWEHQPSEDRLEQIQDRMVLVLLYFGHPCRRCIALSVCAPPCRALQTS